MTIESVLTAVRIFCWCLAAVCAVLAVIMVILRVVSRETRLDFGLLLTVIVIGAGSAVVAIALT